MGFKIAVALTCHNRVKVTAKCLDALAAIRQRPALSGISLRAYVCDDGSSDSTSAAVLRHDWCHLIKGDGSLFWTGGMMASLAEAIKWKPHWLLLLNDDVVLGRDSIERALTCAVEQGLAVVVGQTLGKDGRCSYGGFIWENKVASFSLRRTEIVANPLPVDTFNGNFVLMPTHCYLAVGGLDGSFSHRIADVDLGLRMKADGIKMVVLPGSVGTCDRNAPLSESIQRKAKSVRHAFSLIWGTKAWPPLQLLRYHLRHMGILGVASWSRAQLRPISLAIVILGNGFGLGGRR